jgi:hypothetical protein
VDHAINEGDEMSVHAYDQAPRREHPGAEIEVLSYPRELPAKGFEIGAVDSLIAPIVNGLSPPPLLSEGRITAGVQALHMAGMRRL